MSKMRPIACLRRTSLEKLGFTGFGSNSEEQSSFIKVLSKSKINSLEEFYYEGQNIGIAEEEEDDAGLISRFTTWLSR